jgi:hypothetical protein
MYAGIGCKSGIMQYHDGADARPCNEHHGGAAARAAVAAEPLSALQRHRLATVLWIERDETPADEFAGLRGTLTFSLRLVARPLTALSHDSLMTVTIQRQAIEMPCVSV